MKNKTIIWSGLGLLIIIIMGVMIFRSQNRGAENPAPESQSTAPTGPGTSVQGSGVEGLVVKPVITRTDSGFQPSQTTVKKGTNVVFRNDSSQDMWPASAVHPTHTAYPTSGGCIGSTFDACKGYAPGTSWEFTFDQVGTWGFHDHLHPQFVGKVMVTE